MKQDSSARLEGLDYLRVLCLAAVIGIHSFDTQVVLSLHLSDKFLVFAVPCFFMIAFFLGMREAVKESFLTVSYLKSRFFQLGPLFLGWSFFYALVRVFKNNTWASLNPIEFLKIIFLGDAAEHLYFVPLLFYFTLLILALRRFFGRARMPAALSVLFFLSLFLDARLGRWFKADFVSDTFLVYVFYYLRYALFGALFYFVWARGVSAGLGEARWIRRWSFLILLPLLVMIYINTSWQLWIRTLFYILFFVGCLFGRWRRSAAVEWLSRHSYGLYLSHHLFVESAQAAEVHLGLNLASTGLTLFNFFFAAVCCVVWEKIWSSRLKPA